MDSSQFKDHSEPAIMLLTMGRSSYFLALR